MTTRREVFPLIAGAAGFRPPPLHPPPPRARRSPSSGAFPTAARAPANNATTSSICRAASRNQKQWPVMLFLHGDGERGDASGELDFVLMHGPLFEAWCQRRDLPFVIISPQLDKFSRGEIPYIKYRDAAKLPRRLPAGINARPNAARRARGPTRCRERCRDDKLPDGPTGPPEGWSEMESELLAMVDRTIADFKGDAKRVYLTGLSYGGFGAWNLAARHPQKFAALAPIVGYAHPDHAEPIARAKLPLWVFAGGRDPVVPLRYFYPALNKLEALGHPEVRFTVEEDLGHLTWVRVYEGQDLYSWLLAQARK